MDLTCGFAFLTAISVSAMTVTSCPSWFYHQITAWTTLDVKKARNLATTRFSGLFWTALDYKLVGADGVEPPTFAL